MTHAEMNELYELYALGALEPEQAREIEQHLDERCEYCWDQLRSALQVTAALAGLAEPVLPPAELRERVLSSVRPKVARRQPWFALIGLAAACLALIAVAISLQTGAGSTRRELASLRQERDYLRSAIEILSRPETRTVEFGKAENVPHGRVVVNANGGIVFVGSQLPQLRANQTFEMWLVPANGAPQAAGLFRANTVGDSVNVSALRIASNTKAVAVSIEPQAGSNAPTTTPILVVPL